MKNKQNDLKVIFEGMTPNEICNHCDNESKYILSDIDTIIERLKEGTFIYSCNTTIEANNLKLSYLETCCEKLNEHAQLLYQFNEIRCDITNKDIEKRNKK